jgi:hypothetical protein
MSFDTFTLLLNAADFPFVSDFFQRPVIIPQIDLPPRAGKLVTGTEEGSNKELPQTFYAQNVMPTAEGVMSVGFEQIVPGLSGVTDFDQVITLRDEDENVFLLAPAKGKNYIYREDVGEWVSTNAFTGWTGEHVTRAYVNGRTFVCYENYNIYEYNTVADTFLPITITGLSAADIHAIGASNNYMLAVSGITVHWSSLVDPTDFTPNITTGAGFSIPQDIKGGIHAVGNVSSGFVIYTNKNTVGALYTNNARAPFVFREVSNAGGVISPELVTLDTTTGYHYAYTSAGLQKITAQASEMLETAITDFLAGRVYESFDLTTLTLTLEKLNENLKVKVAYVSNRYLVISYGKISSPQIYTHALVLDTSLKRWGKLRIDHVDCFTYPYPNIIGDFTESPPKQSMAFLQKDGTIQLCILDYRIKQDQGVLLLGRYQLVRQKAITFQSLELESLVQAYPPNVYLVISLDGKTLSAPAALSTLYDNGNIKKYGAPTWSGSGPAPARTGKNISLLAVGTFELSTGVLTLTRHGNR